MAKNPLRRVFYCLHFMYGLVRRYLSMGIRLHGQSWRYNETASYRHLPTRQSASVRPQSDVAMEPPWTESQRSEHPRKAAFRELKEDTGLEPTDMVFIARFETDTTEHYVFVAEFEKDYFAPVPLGEIAECRWLPADPKGLDIGVEAKKVLRAFSADIKSL